MSCAYQALKAGIAIIGKVKPLNTKAGELYTNEISIAIASFLKMVEIIIPNITFAIIKTKTTHKKGSVFWLIGIPKSGCTIEKINMATKNPKSV